MKRFRFLAVGLSVGLVVSTAAHAAASNSWGGFHWERSANPASLEIVDSVVGEWDEHLGPVVGDWNASEVLAVGATPGPDGLVDRLLCLPIPGKIRVCNAQYPNPLWLGLATVYLKGNHIIQATAQMNDTWFDTPIFDDPVARRHVLCQEVGHDFGLDHQYEEPSCMNDVVGLFDPAFSVPSAHDYAQLASVYQHLDGAGPNQDAAGPGGAHAAKHACSRGGCGSTVRVWEHDGMTVVQFILLSPAAVHGAE